MPKRDSSDLARVLGAKAAEDAKAVEVFAASSAIADSIVGFHVQQAVEKWLKAVVALHGGAPKRTHDLSALAAQLEEYQVTLPIDPDELDRLTTYAVPQRYDELLDTEPLDREAAVAALERVAVWARSVLKSDS